MKITQKTVTQVDDRVSGTEGTEILDSTRSGWRMDVGEGKRVSQELFDDVVKENMEEFEMELDEALKDAVSQVWPVLIVGF